MNANATFNITRVLSIVALVLFVGVFGAATMAVEHASGSNVTIASISGKLAKPKVSEIASGAPGEVTVTVDKTKKAKGYQFQIASSKKFDKASSFDMQNKKGKATTAVFTDLTEGSTYYVRVRAYAGKKYGSWSKAKSVAVMKGVADSGVTNEEIDAAKQEAETYKAEAAQYKSDAEAASAELESTKTELRESDNLNEELNSQINKLRNGTAVTDLEDAIKALEDDKDRSREGKVRFSFCKR